jgi:hypothetical protein
MVFAQYKEALYESYWVDHFNKKTYESLLTKARNSYFINIIASQLKKNYTIVEAGAACGRYFEILLELGFKKAQGFDINKELLEIKKKENLT